MHVLGQWQVTSQGLSDMIKVHSFSSSCLSREGAAALCELATAIMRPRSAPSRVTSAYSLQSLTPRSAASDHGQLSDDRRLPGVLLILRPLAGWELQPAAAGAQETEEQPGAGADEGCQAMGVAQQRPGRECRPAGREGLRSLLT